MSAFLTSRLAIGLLALFSLLTTVALTIGGISLTRAGIVSVLPVTSQQSGITVCGHGKATTKPDQARLSLGVFANAASAQDARNQAFIALGSPREAAIEASEEAALFQMMAGLHGLEQGSAQRRRQR